MYTIYESIGKTVVVPYCGSKTINVRLTVSPDSKATDVQTAAEGATTPPLPPSVFQRRYKYRSRKLIPTDGVEPTQTAATDVQPNGSVRLIDLNDSLPRVPPTSPAQPTAAATTTTANDTTTTTQTTTTTDNRHSTPSTPCKTTAAAAHMIRNNCNDNNMSAAAAAAIRRLEEAQRQQQQLQQQDMANYSCRECSSLCPLLDQSVSNVGAAAPTKLRKLMRKSRSKKRHQHEEQLQQQRQQQVPQPQQMRARSLSVGNENAGAKSAAAAAAAAAGGVRRPTSGNAASNGDGGEECLNNLRRNDLIDIIRESMEKNRQCFQSNG